MPTDTILTDDNARQYVYTCRGLVRVDNRAETFDRPKWQDIPQPPHYRLISALMGFVAKARW